MDSLRGLAMLGAFFSFAEKFGDTLEMGTKKIKQQEKQNLVSLVSQRRL